MKILVPIQFVPDLVEELLVDEEQKGLDLTAVRWILNEFDDHALEQAILLKEKYGGEVTVLCPSFDGSDDALFTAAAKGADHLFRLSIGYDESPNTHALAQMFAETLRQFPSDLILTGVSAHNSLDGPLGPILAGILDLPFVGYISGLKPVDGHWLVSKEYPGGLKAEMEVQTPAVLGIQAAETPPRYVPIAKIRQAMKTSKIEELEGPLNPEGGLEISRMYPPEHETKAEMIEGDVDQVAEKLVAILEEQDLL
jgi:electron transfer flavoprotein beta subunit